MLPDVFWRVCYGMPSIKCPQNMIDYHQFKAAVLHGYSRRHVQDADYPGITKDNSSSVRGVYVTNLTPQHVMRLDRFEGDQYKRVLVKVKLLKEDGMEGEEVEAAAYEF